MLGTSVAWYCSIVEVNGVNGTYGSLGIVLQESEVISALKFWEKGLKLCLFTLRLEVCVQDEEELNVSLL